jgi:hypothetical protein
MTQYLDYEGLKEFKKQADAAYLPIKGTIPLTGSINLTTESVASLGIKYAKVANNSINFYVIADSSGKLPSSETRININSDITSLVGAEGANVGDLFVIGKLSLKPVYKIIPLNDAKAANSEFKGTEGVVTPWDKQQINKIASIESTANAARNNFPTYGESNMNSALQTGFYPWCTLGRPDGSTGAYTLLTLASTTKDNAGYTTIEQTAYGRQGDELGKIFKRIIFKKGTEVQLGDWLEITNVAADIDIKKLVIETEVEVADNSAFTFRVTENIAKRMIDIQGIVPCNIKSVQDGRLIATGNFPLNSLGYRITRYVGIDIYNLKISISIDRDTTYNNIPCNVIITASPSIIISYT